ncbi:MAG: prepilin-type N-terminal cleavage/methylation domain-containing protein [Alphaproteobacteria bacterium]
MKNYSKKAFSLIEISIVILIIGLLIAGISKASDMLADSKLKSARSVSRGSIVPRLSNLALWLDTSQAESWPDNKRGTQTYTSSTFSDLNPQTPPTVGFKFTGSYLYTENTGSNLPFLKPSADISSPSPAVPYSSLFDLNGKGLTIFVVAKVRASQLLFAFCDDAACTTAGKKIVLEFDASSKAKFTYPKTATTDETATAANASTFDIGGDKIDIISLTANSSNGNVFSFGKSIGKPTTASPIVSFLSGFFVLESGAELYEIIVVGEFMEDSMRQKVETYLFNKYGVPSGSARGVTAFAAS